MAVGGETNTNNKKYIFPYLKRIMLNECAE
jgi:hypothetical protein